MHITQSSEISVSDSVIYFNYKTDWQLNSVATTIKIEIDKGAGLSLTVKVVIFIVSGILLVVIACILVKCFKSRNANSLIEVRNRYREESEVVPAEVLYTRVLQSSPVLAYNPSVNTFAQAACSICLLPFDAGQFVRKTACNHIFHQGCIESWIRAKINQELTCPMCKFDLIINENHAVPVRRSEVRMNSSNMIVIAPQESNATQGDVSGSDE